MIRKTDRVEIWRDIAICCDNDWRVSITSRRGRERFRYGPFASKCTALAKAREICVKHGLLLMHPVW